MGSGLLMSVLLHSSKVQSNQINGPGSRLRTIAVVAMCHNGTPSIYSVRRSGKSLSKPAAGPAVGNWRIAC